MDKTQFQLFHPSLEDMVKAEKVFSPSPSHRIDYYISAERMDHVPALKQPEVSGYRDCNCQGVQDPCVSNWFSSMRDGPEQFSPCCGQSD